MAIGCLNTHPAPGPDAVVTVQVSFSHRSFSLCRVCALALSSDIQEAVDGTYPRSTGQIKVFTLVKES